MSTIMILMYHRILVIIDRLISVLLDMILNQIGQSIRKQQSWTLLDDLTHSEIIYTLHVGINQTEHPQDYLLLLYISFVHIL